MWLALGPANQEGMEGGGGSAANVDERCNEMIQVARIMQKERFKKKDG